MRTKEIKIGTYEEWKAENETVAQRILEKHSDINVDFEGWYEDIIENFCENVEKIGFNVTIDDVQFSGFWSQGDGASFTGSIDILKYLKETKQLTAYRPLVKAINEGNVENIVGITRDSCLYNHENTCSVDTIEVYGYISPKVEDLRIDLEYELEEKRKDLSIELYRDLEKTYNYLCSEEAIVETLVANEYEFDESGDIA